MKMSGSEKNNQPGRNTCDISSIKCVTRKLHVAVVQKNGKEMYKNV